MDPSALRPHQSPHGVAGGREDCWSEGATEALVEAWGERYVQLGRGNLRQKDWQEVADAVNEHQDALGRPRRTDVQCKNRIDTLKKKYKAEKAKRGPSLWPFFSRLDDLITPPSPDQNQPNKKKQQQQQQQPPPPVTLKLKNRSSPKPGQGRAAAVKAPSPPASSESSRGGAADLRVREEEEEEEEEEDEDEEEEAEEDRRETFQVPRKRRWEGGVDEAFGELARAVERLGEVYERVEGMKQRQMMELERQRMDFAKELEFQRMQMFMEAQLELEKMKRPRGGGGGYSNGGGGSGGAASGEGLGMALVLYWSLFMGAPASY